MSSSSENGSLSTYRASVLDVLQEVRTGRVKKVFGPGIESAIFKTPVTGPVRVTKLGLKGDHQAFEEHGGGGRIRYYYSTAPSITMLGEKNFREVRS
jgi:MOSC domain-containing protein YiiM